jgi:glycosyltransferase involved in cell wall biosynthesis
MKVLISAWACSPYSGSESFFGWSAVKCLAHGNSLWVITNKQNQGALERAAVERLVPSNIRFAYAGGLIKWHSNRTIAKLQDWAQYIQFTKEALAVAQELHQKEKFDVVHHVTLATWRVASRLWQLGIPFIQGPIGGNEQFPLRLFPMLSPSGAAYEALRKASNIRSRLSPAVRRCLRHAAHIFAASVETERLVKAIRGSDTGISRLSPGFYTAEQVAAYSRFVSQKSVTGPLRLFASGNLSGHKGLAMALKALAIAKSRGANFRYHLGAGGPEIPHLKNMAAKLGISNEMVFGGPMSPQDYQRELGNTDIYLLPSLRESAGLTMMEAMLSGCVPLVADCGAPSFIVSDECGYKISVSSQSRIIEQIANVVLALDRDRKIVAQKGALASKRIATHFTEEHYRQAVNAVYRSVRSK